MQGITGHLLWKSENETAAQECARTFAVRVPEEIVGILVFDNAAMVQKHDVMRQPPCLTDVMRDQDDLDAATLGIEQLPLDRQG
jgi:hypothetical protein